MPYLLDANVFIQAKNEQARFVLIGDRSEPNPTDSSRERVRA